MSVPLPQTLALDFDGVLCNGLQEYFLTTWRAYGRIWLTSSPEPPSGLAERFYCLRPVIETGWEMPVLLRAILKGYSESQVLADWASIRDRIVVEEDLERKSLSQQVDGVRDHWIATDLNHWLALHQFYPGVIPQLQQLSQATELIIISTKESRFIYTLLTDAGVHFSRDRIYGKDCRRPKYETLRLLVPQVASPIWFLEDRIAALEQVKQQSDLSGIELFLGTWGYNTARDRKHAQTDQRIHALDLDQFCQSLSTWIT
ncbi:HAD family hydrolase [Acaryochloris sp. IP29b_bin.137]|uniref:HAD family hydrolase n=1 Tax=Acaryochloris sp. IP29b_bin.137 TaxID=2969217 RepID=UPI0026246BEE|nr:HAD family hydrolase [Acaryochloris sp. IP29b_bin.137]